MFGLAGKWRFRRRDRLARLAEAIENSAAADRERIRESERLARLRDFGAVELYSICRGLVDALNGRLSEPAVVLDPPVYAAQDGDDRRRIFQISLRGRLLQIEFAPPREPVSTEDFRTPYVLAGAVRSFNQEMLERESIDEQSIFYCLEGERARWRFSDNRTYRSGKLTADLLVRELERLVGAEADGPRNQKTGDRSQKREARRETGA